MGGTFNENGYVIYVLLRCESNSNNNQSTSPLPLSSSNCSNKPLTNNKNNDQQQQHAHLPLVQSCSSLNKYPAKRMRANADMKTPGNCFLDSVLFTVFFSLLFGNLQKKM